MLRILVREKAKTLNELLNNPDLLASEREKTKQVRMKIGAGSSCFGGSSGRGLKFWEFNVIGSSRYGGFSSYDYNAR